ncbi:hypothetical protein BJF79_45035 [Actinomadura sp. CNU-125]|uniref:hypothetical protein n=1 Tax=Actinomadura sp. CNU-125 TaxID=1904961 RepID=UPI0009602F92|nr:hypothetical protein [Actinomadura sp. CNU-125]OLT24569.1 hypothetical protein BJF79_45035 [Actinomadura sp. CNU-125]
MGRSALVLRLALRDLRRRPAQAFLLLTAITATAATLTLGLLVRGAADDPWERTRAATAGPDAVPRVGRGAPQALAREPEVTGTNRPYPTLSTTLRAGDTEVMAVVQGRDTDLPPAPDDRPAAGKSPSAEREGAVPGPRRPADGRPTGGGTEGDEMAARRSIGRSSQTGTG